MNIETLQKEWLDVPDWHRSMKEYFDEEVNKDLELKSLRDWIEQKIFGFGERAFYYMWKKIVEEMPNEFKFLEIGVFRGQVLALIQLLANQQNKKANIVGVSPMTSQGGYWESNYEEDVKTLFDAFNLGHKYYIAKHDSTSPDALLAVGPLQPYDIIYIDGGHEKQTVIQDFNNYAPMLKSGGYLVMDDCCNTFKLPTSYFAGHPQVTQAVNELLPPVTKNDDFEFLFNIVHNRVWRKK